MSTTMTGLLVALVLSQKGNLTADTMQPDLDRLVFAAGQLTGTWPFQAPPPIPEVGLVARHGRRAGPLLVALLTDDPAVERDRKRFQVAQQATLTLCRIYSESQHCGRTYCDADVPERIAHVEEGWLRLIAADADLRALSSKELLNRFRQEPVFWREAEIGRALAATGDGDIVEALASSLAHDDRHVRGNVALVLGRLGDPRGFATIAGNTDGLVRASPGQGIPGGMWNARAQFGPIVTTPRTCLATSRTRAGSSCWFRC